MDGIALVSVWCKLCKLCKLCKCECSDQVRLKLQTLGDTLSALEPCGGHI